MGKGSGQFLEFPITELRHTGAYWMLLWDSGFNLIWKDTNLPKPFRDEALVRTESWFEKLLETLESNQTNAKIGLKAKEEFWFAELRKTEGSWRLEISSAEEVIEVEGRFHLEIWTKDLLDKAPDPMLVFCLLDNSPAFANSSFLKLRGCDLEAIKDCDLHQSLGFNADSTPHNFDQILKNKIPPLIQSYLRDGSGKLIPVLINSLDIYLNEKPHRLLVFINQEERVSILEKEKQIFFLFENISIGVIYQDAEGQITLANSAAERLLGLTKSELNGATYTSSSWILLNQDGSELAFEEHPFVKARNTGLPVNSQFLGLVAPGKTTPLWLEITVKPEFRDNEAIPYRFLTSFHDVTRQINAQKNLQLQNLRHKLLTRTAKNFINLPLQELDSQIHQTMEELGKTLEVDRFYIFDYDFEAHTCTNTYEWCAEGIQPEIQNLKDFPVNHIPDWLNAHKEGKIMGIPDVLGLEPGHPMRQILEPQGIQSMITVPLMNDKLCIGFIGLDAVKKRHVFSDTEQDLLLVFAEMLVNVHNRIQQFNYLKEKEILFRRITENISDMIWVADLDFKLEYVSPSVVRVFGDEPEVFLKRSDEERYSVETCDKLSAIRFDISQTMMKSTISYGKSWNLEGEGFRNSGESFWFSTNIRPNLNENAELIGWIGVTRDISRKKKTELELRQSQERLQKLLENQTIYVLRTDLQGRHTYWNKKFEKDCGFLFEGRENLPGNAEFTVMEYDRPKMREAVYSCISEPGRVIQLELDKPKKDGGIRTTLWEFVCLTNDDGVPSEMQCTGLDITDRKKNEQLIQSSEEKYRSLVESSDATIVLFDKEGVMLFCNTIAAQNYGLSPSDLIGKSIRDFVQPAEFEDIKKDIDWVIGTNSSKVHEPSLYINGKTIWLRTSIQPVRNEQGIPYAVLMNATNITEQKLARLKLEESEQRFKSLFFDSPDAHLIVHNGKYTDCNEAACKMLGYQPEFIIGKTPAEISPEFQKNGLKSCDQVKANLATAKQKGKHSFEWSLKKADGNTIDCEVTLTSIQQKEGDVTFVTWQNLTEVKVMQEALLRSEERFSQVAIQSKTVVWELNTEGLYTYVSNLSEEVYGYKPEELINKMYFYDLHPEESREEYKAAAQLMLEKEEPLSDYENPIVKKSGELIWVSSNAIPFYNENGQLMGYRGSDIDITEKKNAIEELNKFRIISDQANYGSSIALLDGTITYINNAFASIHGYTVEEVLGKPLTLFHNESQLPRVFDLLKQLETEGGFVAEEVEHITRDGRVFPTLMSGKVIRDEDGKPLYFAATAVDISRLKQTEQELRKREEELNYAQEIAQMGSWEYDLENEQVILSDAYYKLVERGPDEYPATYENFLSIVHPEDHGVIQEALEDIYKNQNEIAVQIRLIMPDGSLKWVRNNIVPIFKNKVLVGLKGVNINISKQKAQEEQIRQQNQQLSAIIDALPDPVFISDSEGNFLDYVRSRTISKQRDYSGHINSNISDWLQPEYSKQVLEKIREALRDNKITTIEYPAIDIDKEHKIFESRIVPLDQNRVLRMVRDITERKLQDEEIRKLTKAIEQSPVAIIITDIHAHIVYASPGTLQITGYNPEELIGRSTKIFKSGKTPASVYANLWETLAKGETWEFEWLNAKKNGNEYWESTSISPLTNEAGELVGYMSIKQDISERKRAEEEIRLLNLGLESKIEERTKELQEKSRELETFFTVALDLLCIADINGHFIKVNKAWESILGYPVSDLEGQLFTNFVHPEDLEATFDAMKDLGDQKTVLSFTNRYRCSDGTYRFIEWHSVPVGVLIYSAARDITDRIMQENALNQARELAEQANKAKSDFLSRMSHELRTPMNSILGFAQLLEMGGLNQHEQKSVNHILKSGKHLLNLINEVLDISRIEAGRVSISIEPISIQSILDEVSDLLNPTASKHQISLEFVHLESDWMVEADKQRLKQILINLVGNAIKYNRPGAWVRVQCQEIDMQGFSWVKIEVIDNGPGIAKEDLERIFRPFERVGDESINTEGTGLGLAVVKQLTDLMGGLYGVMSEPGYGSTFWVQFRSVVLPKKNMRIENQSQEESGIKRINSGKILYIEDNHSNVELLENVLSMRFPSVELISHAFGKDTVKLALEHKPDLIFLDLNLPDGHGSSFLSELLNSQETKSIPVYVVSADAMPETISSLMKIGAKGYITKPIDLSVLLKLIDEHLS